MQFISQNGITPCLNLYWSSLRACVVVVGGVTRTRRPCPRSTESYLSCPWCCSCPLSAGLPSVRVWPRWSLRVCRCRCCSLCRQRSSLRRYRPAANIRSHRKCSFSCRPPASSCPHKESEPKHVPNARTVAGLRRAAVAAAAPHVCGGERTAGLPRPLALSFSLSFSPSLSPFLSRHDRRLCCRCCCTEKSHNPLQ